MKTWVHTHKKVSITLALFFAMVVIATGWGIFLAAFTKEAEAVYREERVQYGPLSVGITKEGVVSVGTVEQGFSLDLSAYTNERDSDNFRGWMGGGMPGMQNGDSHESGSRSLEVEEVFITVGQRIEQGVPLLKLTEESVEDIRSELVSDEESARLEYDNLLLDQRKAVREASWEREQNLVYGNGAAAEYEETMYQLQQAMEEAQESLKEAEDTLAEYQADLEAVRSDYEEAVSYLKEATAAVESETDTYWYLKNEESREQAKRTVEEEEAQTEQLEDQIWEAQQEIILLRAACHEAELAYQNGEADALARYDKLLYQSQQAEEVYAIATDLITYQVQVAKEDYETAVSKLQTFDAEIVDGVVSAEYEGVITAVDIQAGDTMQSDTVIATLNNYEDVLVSVDVESGYMDSVAVGDSVRLTFPAFPEELFDGVVSHIGEAFMDGNTAYRTVEISVEGDVSGLYGGMSGEATFITRQSEETLYVPRNAVIREEDGSFVNMRDAEGNIVRREVVTGFSDGTCVEIQEGLQEGDTVLIESKRSGE